MLSEPNLHKMKYFGVHDIVYARTGVSHINQYKWMKVRDIIFEGASKSHGDCLMRMKRLRRSNGYFPIAEKALFKLFKAKRGEKRKVRHLCLVFAFQTKQIKQLNCCFLASLFNCHFDTNVIKNIGFGGVVASPHAEVGQGNILG